MMLLLFNSSDECLTGQSERVALASYLTSPPHGLDSYTATAAAATTK